MGEVSLNDSFTQKLIASKDDSKDTQFRVTKDGIFFLSEEVGNTNIDGLLFRLETNCAGNSYASVEASKDDKWTQRIYEAVIKHWPDPDPESSYVDFF